MRSCSSVQIIFSKVDSAPNKSFFDKKIFAKKFDKPLKKNYFGELFSEKDVSWLKKLYTQ